MCIYKYFYVCIYMYMYVHVHVHVRCARCYATITSSNCWEVNNQNLSWLHDSGITPCTWYPHMYIHVFWLLRKVNKLMKVKKTDFPQLVDFSQQSELVMVARLWRNTLHIVHAHVQVCVCARRYIHVYVRAYTCMYYRYRNPFFSSGYRNPTFWRSLS
jgi:hypothetical protein